jgi:hypothetical protein
MADPTDSELLLWLGDAPLFIDEQQIRGFYDAVVRPPGKESATIEVSDLNSFKKALGIKGGVSVGLSKLLSVFGVSVGAEGSMEKSGERDIKKTFRLESIDTPHRQLIDLTAWYAAVRPTRLLTVSAMATGVRWKTTGSWTQTGEWHSEAFIRQTPRALAFVDIPPLSKFIPTAAELDQGRVVPFYRDLILELANSKTGLPDPYPESAPGQSEGELLAERKKYWSWFAESYNPQRAMQIVETVVNRNPGLIQWIDFRVPVGKDGTTMHLHFQGYGRYPTGTFAYNLVKRGYKHGMRLVGTLKSEPDLNVLAAFEK